MTLIYYHDIGVSIKGGSATRKRKECAERTCEGVILLMQSKKGRCLSVVSCSYWMSRRPHVGGYAYDCTGVNELRLWGPVPEVGTWLPAMTRVGSRILSLTG